MHIPKKYFHDRLVLLLLSANAFLVIIITIATLLRLGGGGGYFVQYRQNLGLNAFTVGSIVEILSFIVFAVAILGFHTFISLRTYSRRRSIALTILAMATLLLLLTLIVSNELLVLR